MDAVNFLVEFGFFALCFALIAWMYIQKERYDTLKRVCKILGADPYEMYENIQPGSAEERWIFKRLYTEAVRDTARLLEQVGDEELRSPVTRMVIRRRLQQLSYARRWINTRYKNVLV